MNLSNVKRNQTETSELTEKPRVAIYIFIQRNDRKLVVSRQVKTCQKFLEKQKWVFSGDLFAERQGTQQIARLAHARAWSKRFDYIVSYLPFNQNRESSEEIGGIIACLDAQTFACSNTALFH